LRLHFRAQNPTNCALTGTFLVQPAPAPRLNAFICLVQWQPSASVHLQTKQYLDNKNMPPNDPFSRRRRSSTVQSPFKPGDRIRAIDHYEHHSYQPGRVYTVTTVDRNDSTLKAQDAMGSEGNWIKWRDCKKTDDIGWEWLKTVLPAEALDLLAAFDGLEGLSLREDLRNRLVLQIPGLHDKILGAMADEEAALPPPNEEDSTPGKDSLNDLLDFEDLD
jgi:hypothetical protein